MSVRTDVINLTVNINGDKGKNELNQLRKQAADLASEMTQLNKRTKEGREEWNRKNTELTAIKNRMAELRQQMGLTALSQKELTSELRRLQALKNVATPQTREFFELQQQIDAVSARLRNVRNGTFGFKAMLGSIKDEVKQFGLLAASYLGFEFFTNQAHNLIRAQKSMADENADIAKTTGLAKNEIKELNKALREMDTRTSNSRLRELASEAGKLGIEGVENIKKFVEQADKIEVALGEDLGDGGLMKVAKIANIFGLEMTNVASGINSVGQASAATEAYQVDFAFRMAGTAQTARIAAGDILGFASALELNGQQTEMAATALNTFFLDFISKSEDFGRAAGFARGELGQLINDRGVNEAFLQWLQRLKDASPTTQAFIDKMRSLGIDGARGSSVMLVLAENLGMVRDQQALANREIEKGTSILKEFDTKNNNFAATVDKLSKKINSFFTSDSVNRMVTGTVEAFGKLLDILPEIFGWVQRNITVITAWTVVYLQASGVISRLITNLVSLTTGIQASNAVIALSTLKTRAIVAATLAWDIAVAAVTFNTTKLRNAWVAFNVVLNVNPFTAILTVIAGTITALSLLAAKVKGVGAAMEAQLEVQKRTALATVEQELKVRTLVDAIKDHTTNLEQKKKYIQQLIALDPAYLNGLTLANIYTAEGTNILEQYVLKLREKAKAEALQSYQVEIEKKRIDLIAERNEKTEQLLKMYGKEGSALSQLGDSFKSWFGAGLRGDIKDINSELGKLGQKAIAVEKEIKSSLKTQQPGKIQLPITDSDSKIADIEGKKTTEDRSGNKSENELRTIRQQMAAIKTELEAARKDIETGQKQYDEKEIARVINKYAALLDKAKKYAAEHAELTKMQQQELDILYQKQFTRRSDNEYDETLKNITSFFQSQKEKVHDQYINGEITKAKHALVMKQLEKEEYEARALAAQDYAEVVKKAEGDLAKYKEQSKSKEIAELEEGKEQGAQSKVDAAQSHLNLAKPGSLGELKAHKDLLQAKFEQDTLYMDQSSEAYKAAKDQLNREMAELDKKYYLGLAATALQVLQGISNIYSEYVQGLNAKDNAQLQEEKEQNEEKKKQFKKQLDNKKISRATYDNEVSKLDEQMEAKEKEARKREAKRNKSAALFNAIIGTAQAIVNALTLQPFWVGLAMAAVAATMGGVQISNISSTKEPTGRKGLIVPGPSHEDHGVDLIERKSGKVLANVEGGEPLWVFSKETYKNNKEILDELIYNSMNKNGARIGAGKWYQRNDQQINTARIIPLMRAGGNVATGQGSTNVTDVNTVTDTTVNNNNTGDMTESNALLREVVAELKANRQEIATMKREMKAKVYLKDIHDAEDLLDKAKSVAGINQAA